MFDNIKGSIFKKLNNKKMKTIKKVTLLMLALFISVGVSNAQGIQAGYSMSKPAGSNVSLNGFHAGLTADLAIQGSIGLEYGLLYNYLTTNKNFMSLADVTTTAHRIDVPFRVSAGFPIANNINLSLFAGPNFNFGISQVSVAKTGLGNLTSENIYSKKYNDGKLYSPFDLQIGGGAGLDFGNIGLRVSYDLGLLDRDNSNSEWKNDDFKVGIVYSF